MTIKLSDFGFAKELKEGETLTGKCLYFAENCYSFKNSHSKALVEYVQGVLKSIEVLYVFVCGIDR